MRPKFFNTNKGGGGMPGAITPQGKLVGTSDRMGNWGIKDQQGTSVTIYDSLPFDGRSEWNFFEGASARNFPFTNVNQAGGMLGVGESLVIARAYFVNFTVDPQTGAVTAFSTIDAVPSLLLGEMSFLQNNSRVIKRFTLSSFGASFNVTSKNASNVTHEFDTYLTIQPQLEFVANVKPTAGITVQDTYLRLVLEGPGSIPSTKQNF